MRLLADATPLDASFFGAIAYQPNDAVLFFFQAEDGIRDSGVTGVQTCALPIFHRSPGRSRGPPRGSRRPVNTARPVADRNARCPADRGCIRSPGRPEPPPAWSSPSTIRRARARTTQVWSRAVRARTAR